MENLLKQLKKYYESVHPPQKLANSGWEDLSRRIDKDNFVKRNPYRFFFSRLSFAALLFILFFSAGSLGIYQAAKKSLPGSPFYPVRKTVENLQSAVSGNHQLIINERARDVLESTMSGSFKNLEKSVDEYQKSLENLKKEKEDDKEKRKTQDLLKIQEETLKNLKSEVSTHSSGQIEKAYESVKETRKEIEDGKKEENGKD